MSFVLLSASKIHICKCVAQETWVQPGINLILIQVANLEYDLYKEICYLNNCIMPV